MIIIIGKTASGKDTIVKELCQNHNFKKIVTYTTRPMRENEINGITYHFISDVDFKQKINEGFFTEYKSYQSEFGEWFYGTSEESIINSDSKSIIILTPQGYKDILSKYPNLNYKSIYLYASNRTIRERLIQRGDDEAEAIRRVKHDKKDFRGIEKIVDNVICNNKDRPFEKVIKNILEVITK
uniref:guanylate kinase n=1 Tax=Coprococcus catus TaxID=116085 RepID=UPI0022E872AE|nr:AAA family ATPase [Coprococcus catus]